MASGKLGTPANITAADTAVMIYQVPASTIATVNIRIANRNIAQAEIRVAISTAATAGAIALADYIDYDVLVPGHGVLEDTGIVCSSGERVWIVSNLANISVRVHGFEEAA